MPARSLLLRRHSVLPGFNLALGFTVLYLCFIVLIPLSAISSSGRKVKMRR